MLRLLRDGRWTEMTGMADPRIRNLFPNTERQAKIFLSVLILLPIVLFGVLVYAGVSLRSLAE